MAQIITARLSRNDAQPWGFRLQGGKDFGTPLVIQKVSTPTNTVEFNVVFVSTNAHLPAQIVIENIMTLLCYMLAQQVETHFIFHVWVITLFFLVFLEFMILFELIIVKKRCCCCCYDNQILIMGRD